MALVVRRLAEQAGSRRTRSQRDHRESTSRPDDAQDEGGFACRARNDGRAPRTQVRTERLTVATALAAIQPLVTTIDCVSSRANLLGIRTRLIRAKPLKSWRLRRHCGRWSAGRTIGAGGIERGNSLRWNELRMASEQLAGC